MSVVPDRSSGFTLLELLVVLVVMGLSVALVAPALVPPERSSASLQGLVRETQSLAVRRGETLLLRVSPQGRWDVVGTSSGVEGPVEAGVLSGSRPPGPVTLRVSPLGACAWDLGDAADAWRPALDPLTCRLLGR